LRAPLRARVTNAENEYNVAASQLLSVPHEKSAFGYNISTAVSASLASIAAGAKFCCCAAFLRFGAGFALIGT
jgi:hypothetical protein